MHRVQALSMESTFSRVVAGHPAYEVAMGEILFKGLDTGTRQQGGKQCCSDRNYVGIKFVSSYAMIEKIFAVIKLFICRRMEIKNE